MARDLKADSLMYLPLEAVGRCIGIPEERLCRACITGNYPTPTGEELYQLALKSAAASGDESKGGDGRTYEMCIPNGANGRVDVRETNGELVTTERVVS
jgi:amidophosphoribosyltransferase